jgi:uncharacterized protein YqjF (DUF2071 family)
METTLSSGPVLPAAPERAATRYVFQPGGTQVWPVSGTLTDRLLVTFRMAEASLAPLVPAPLELDTYRGYGFLSVCAVEIEGMGLVGTPSFLRWSNREFLYRLGVRLRGEPTFITLRSDVSSRALALLGRYFSHFRPQLGRVELTRRGETLRMTGVTPRGDGDADVQVQLDAEPRHGSVFDDERQAAQRLLGMRFATDVVRGRVRVQEIEHGPWRPRLVRTDRARFCFVDSLAQQLGASFELDSTLAVRDVPHVWKAARWIR